MESHEIYVGSQPEEVEADVCQSYKEIFEQGITYDVFSKILEQFPAYDSEYFLWIYQRMRDNKFIISQEKKDFQKLLDEEGFQEEMERWFSRINFKAKGSREELFNNVESFGELDVKGIVKYTQERLFRAVSKHEVENNPDLLDEWNIGRLSTGELVYLRENGELEVLKEKPLEENLCFIQTEDGERCGIYDLAKNSLVGGWKKSVYLLKKEVKFKSPDSSEESEIRGGIERACPGEATYLSKKVPYELSPRIEYELPEATNGRKVVAVSHDGLHKLLDVDTGEEIGGHTDILFKSPMSLLSDGTDIYKVLNEDGTKAFYDRNSGEKITDGFENVETISYYINGQIYLPGKDISDKFFVYEKGKKAVYDSQRGEVISEWSDKDIKVVNTDNGIRGLVTQFTQSGDSYFLIDVMTGERISDVIESDYPKNPVVIVKRNLGRVFIPKDGNVVEMYDMDTGNFIKEFNISLDLLQEDLNIRQGKNRIIFGNLDKKRKKLQIFDLKTGEIVGEKSYRLVEDTISFFSLMHNSVNEDENGDLYVKKLGRKQYL